MIGALVRACRQRLITDLGETWDNRAKMDIQLPPGMPPPDCGQKFIAIWASSHSPGLLNQEEGIDEICGVTVTVTFRTGEVPEADLAKQIVHKAATGMEALSRAIMVSLVKNRWDVLQLANAEIVGTDNFVEPLRWLGTDIGPTPRGPDWFTADVENPNARDFGLSMDIRFGQARRLQTFANME
jgi:hypothetical protein